MSMPFGRVVFEPLPSGTVVIVRVDGKVVGTIVSLDNDNSLWEYVSSDGYTSGGCGTLDDVKRSLLEE